MDLHSRMERFGGPVERPSDDVIAGVIGQGRVARRNRRRKRIAGGSALGVAAVAAAFSLVAGSVAGTAGTPATKPPTAVAAPAAGGVVLVAYEGKQPNLFTIDTVPQGFFVQGQNEYELVLAPERAKSAEPGSELGDPRMYTGKIAVYLQNKDFMVDPEGQEQFTIGGKAAALRSIPEETRVPAGPDGRPQPTELTGLFTTQIFVVQAPTVYLTVQFAGTLGLTREQMVEVAGGINLTPEAIAEAEAAYAVQKMTPGKGN